MGEEVFMNNNKRTKNGDPDCEHKMKYCIDPESGACEVCLKCGYFIDLEVEG